MKLLSDPPIARLTDPETSHLSAEEITRSGVRARQHAEYRSIDGYPGYRVGSDGTVWTCKRRGTRRNDSRLFSCEWRQLKLTPTGLGYLRCTLSHNNIVKDFSVHRIVLEAFRGPNPGGLVCRHLDGDPQNNCADNLRWGTYTENENDKLIHGRRLMGERVFGARLTSDRVIAARRRYMEGETMKQIASDFGVHITCVHRAIQGKTWGHIKSAVKYVPHSKKKLDENSVREIRNLRQAGLTFDRIAERLNVSSALVKQVCCRKAWSHVV